MEYRFHLRRHEQRKKLFLGFTMKKACGLRLISLREISIGSPFLLRPLEGPFFSHLSGL